MDDVSTLTDVPASMTGRRAVWGRRAVITSLTVFVVAGGTGFLGVRTSTATDSGAGYELKVRYAAVARAGLDVPLQVKVRHPGGFGDQLMVAVTGDYFDIFETQGFTPNPSAATRDATTLLLTFDAPEGETFTFAYDAYIQPSSQQGKDATVTVLDGGVAVASTHLTTRLVP